jgi:hypothetical protein
VDEPTRQKAAEVMFRFAQGAIQAAIDAGFVPPDHGLEPQHIFEYVSGPYEPFMVEEFTYTKDWTSKALQKVIDMQGNYGDVIRILNMPTSYVILDRVVWGMSALLGRLNATNNWRGLLAEYRKGAPPVTELGRIEARWRADRAASEQRR